MSRLVQSVHTKQQLFRKIPLHCQQVFRLSGSSYVNCLFNDIRKLSTSQAINKGCSYSQLRQIKTEIIAFRGLLERSGFLERTSASLYKGQKRGYASENDKEKTSDGDKDEEQEMKEKAQRMIYLSTLLFIAFITSVVLSSLIKSKQVEMTWNDFEKELLSKGMVKDVTIMRLNDTYKEKMYVNCYGDAKFKGIQFQFPEQFYIYSKTEGWFEKKIQEFEAAHGIDATNRLPIHYTSADAGPFATIFSMFLFMMVIGLLLDLTRARTGKMGKPTKLKQSSPSNFQDAITDMLREPMKLTIKRGDQMVQNIKFKDVAGLHEAKVEILEFVDYIKSPNKFKKLGASVPKGALLLGPPGCGKTLLAKALAAEANVPFLVLAGTDFVQVIGGLGASRVRQLFQEAREKAPCIIYIDEIDALGTQRAQVSGSGGNSETEQTLNQLLVEMDGMGTTDGVLLLASTNRSDVLDKALLRPGRFNRHILIDLPTVMERVELFEIYLAKLKLEKPISAYAVKLAQRTPGMTGADVSAVCNEAAIHAARNTKKEVTAEDFEYALERLSSGVVKNTNTLSPADRNISAYHESGHALMEWLSESTEKLLKVSILPRTKAKVGFSQYAHADIYLQTKEDLYIKLCNLLGGRVAVSLVFNKVTTVAEEDLKKATKLATDMISSYGMNDTVGQVSFPTDEDDFGFRKKPYSRALQQTMDAEARKLIASAYKHTEDVLKNNMDKLHLIANGLLEKETLDYAEVEQMIGPPPHKKFAGLDNTDDFFENK